MSRVFTRMKSPAVIDVTFCSRQPVVRPACYEDTPSGRRERRTAGRGLLAGGRRAHRRGRRRRRRRAACRRVAMEAAWRWTRRRPALSAPEALLEVGSPGEAHVAKNCYEISDS